MHRTQLLLPVTQVQFLQDEADRMGVSMSELIRQWIGERMEATAKATVGPDAGAGLIGLGSGGAGRASERHDEELARNRAGRARRESMATTSALYALVDAHDAHHAEAVRFWNSLGSGVAHIVTDTTLMEAMTLIEVGLGHAIACRALDAIRKSTRYRIVTLTAEDREEMWRILERFADKEWSPFDCASLAVAKRREITEAFAFDTHFDQMAALGLLRVPPKPAG